MFLAFATAVGAAWLTQASSARRLAKVRALVNADGTLPLAATEETLAKSI